MLGKRKRSPLKSWSHKKKRKGALARYVKRVINKQSERKFASVNASSGVVGNAPSTAYAHLSGIAQGDGAASRDGNEIRLKSIQIKYNLVMNASATATTVRVVLVRMKSTISDTAPDWNDIFEDDSTVSMKDHRLAQRFTILYDRTHCLSSGGPQIVARQYYKRCDYKVKFNGTAANDVESGPVYLFACSNEATNTPTINYATRVSYTDH